MTKEEAEFYVYVNLVRETLEDECRGQCIDVVSSRSRMERALIEALCGEHTPPDNFKARNRSLHCKKDGRIFQMQNAYGKPMPYASAKHNYTKSDLDRLGVGQSIGFQPMFGNVNPICSNLLRVK